MRQCAQFRAPLWGGVGDRVIHHVRGLAGVVVREAGTHPEAAFAQWVLVHFDAREGPDGGDFRLWCHPKNLLPEPTDG